MFLSKHNKKLPITNKKITIAHNNKKLKKLQFTINKGKSTPRRITRTHFTSLSDLCLAEDEGDRLSLLSLIPNICWNDSLSFVYNTQRLYTPRIHAHARETHSNSDLCGKHVDGSFCSWHLTFGVGHIRGWFFYYISSYLYPFHRPFYH